MLKAILKSFFFISLFILAINRFYIEKKLVSRIFMYWDHDKDCNLRALATISDFISIYILLRQIPDRKFYGTTIVGTSPYYEAEYDGKNCSRRIDVSICITHETSITARSEINDSNFARIALESGCTFIYIVNLKKYAYDFLILFFYGSCKMFWMFCYIFLSLTRRKIFYSLFRREGKILMKDDTLSILFIVNLYRSTLKIDAFFDG